MYLYQSSLTEYLKMLAGVCDREAGFKRQIFHTAFSLADKIQ
jgi:hypothetical protein